MIIIYSRIIMNIFTAISDIGLLQKFVKVIQNQRRNTFILKRKYPARLSKINGYKKKLKARNFIYEIDEITESLKQPDIRVILTTFVEGFGNRGDILSVRPKTARCDLILTGLAVYASPDNIAEFEKEGKDSSKPVMIPGSRFVGQTQKYMSTRLFPVEMNLEEPWTIEPWHIRIAFRRMGFVVPGVVIELPEKPISGPNEDYEDKDFAVFITINKSRRFPIRCRIRHWSSSTQKMTPILPNWYTKPSSSVLKEQEELLSNMPELQPHE